MTSKRYKAECGCEIELEGALREIIYCDFHGRVNHKAKWIRRLTKEAKNAGDGNDL